MIITNFNYQSVSKCGSWTLDQDVGRLLQAQLKLRLKTFAIDSKRTVYILVLDQYLLTWCKQEVYRSCSTSLWAVHILHLCNFHLKEFMGNIIRLYINKTWFLKNLKTWINRIYVKSCLDVIKVATKGKDNLKIHTEP